LKLRREPSGKLRGGSLKAPRGKSLGSLRSKVTTLMRNGRLPARAVFYFLQRESLYAHI